MRREARLLVERLRLWTPQRFAASTPPWGSRGDLVHHLAQDLVDRAALGEGAVARRLPRLDSDLALPDQLAVSADDLVRAGLSHADAVMAAAHLLFHRTELLDDAVPAGLARALGLEDVVSAGRRACDSPAPDRTRL